MQPHSPPNVAATDPLRRAIDHVLKWRRMAMLGRRAGGRSAPLSGDAEKEPDLAANATLPEPAEARFERPRNSDDPDKLAAFYMAAGEMHLRRAMQLADTEWKVSIAFWAALLASGVSFISFTNNSTLPMTEYIAHSDYLFLIPYLFASGVFLFTFSRNQAVSIVTERTRYRYCQNQAAKLLGSGLILPHDGAEFEADPTIAVAIIGDGNRVWAAKLLSTFSFVTGIWAAAQWLAHGKIDSEKTAMARSAARALAGSGPDMAAFTSAVEAAEAARYRPLPWTCAFQECSSGGDLEIGTLLWIVAAAVMLGFFLKASRRRRY